MTTWQAVLTAALMGSERSALTLQHRDTATGPDGAAPGTGADWEDLASALLDEAALLTVARRAGRLPDRAVPVPEPEPDPRPPAGRAADRRLARILGGENADLLAEWLIAATARGLRPPPRHLPALLDRVRRVASADDAELRVLVAAAGGPRARWLAAMNPAWAYLLAYPPGGPAGTPRLEYLDRDAFAQRVTLAVRQLSNAPLTASRDLRAAGRAADPALGAPGALADFPPSAPNVLHTMLAVVRFRYEMLRELDEGADDDHPAHDQHGA